VGKKIKVWRRSQIKGKNEEINLKIYGYLLKKKCISKNEVYNMYPSNLKTIIDGVISQMRKDGLIEEKGESIILKVGKVELQI